MERPRDFGFLEIEIEELEPKIDPQSDAGFLDWIRQWFR